MQQVTDHLVWVVTCHDTIGLMLIITCNVCELLVAIYSRVDDLSQVSTGYGPSYLSSSYLLHVSFNFIFHSPLRA